MSSDESAPGTLCGHLLLAAPPLLEPTFRRTVILITNHSQVEGALGYVLNRPLNKKVHELLPSSPFEELSDVPVYIGGPVSQEHLTFSSLGWSDANDSLQYQTHLSAQEASRAVKEGFTVRAFVGYSGWSEGQLENELKDQAWIVALPRKEVMDPRRLNAELWARLIREISPLHRLAADMPDDPSLN